MMDIKKMGFLPFAIVGIIASVTIGTLITKVFCKLKAKDGWCGLSFYFIAPALLFLAFIWRYTNKLIFNTLSIMLIVFLAYQVIESRNKDAKNAEKLRKEFEPKENGEISKILTK